MGERDSQVVSARIPAALARQLLAYAEEHGLRPSDVVREALDAYLGTGPRVRGYDVVVVQAGFRVRVLRDEPGYETENPVVTEHDIVFAPGTVALGGA